MNYATTITAEAQDDIPGDAMERYQEKQSSNLMRNLLIAGGALLALLLALGAYFALAGGEPVGAGDDNGQAPVVTVIAPGRTTVSGAIVAPGTIAARRPMPVGVVGEGGADRVWGQGAHERGLSGLGRRWRAAWPSGRGAGQRLGAGGVRRHGDGATPKGRPPP